MNHCLLDTSVVLYILKYPERIGKQTRELLKATDANYISAVSFWEIVLKLKKGKLRIPRPLREIMEFTNGTELPLQYKHVLMTTDIELSHNDPFDHMLIAQSVSENMPLLTIDKILLRSAYNTIDARK